MEATALKPGYIDEKIFHEYIVVEQDSNPVNKSMVLTSQNPLPSTMMQSTNSLLADKRIYTSPDRRKVSKRLE